MRRALVIVTALGCATGGATPSDSAAPTMLDGGSDLPATELAAAADTTPDTTPVDVSALDTALDDVGARDATPFDASPAADRTPLADTIPPSDTSRPMDAPPDFALSDTIPIPDATHDGAPSPDAAPFTPTALRARLVFTGPSGVTTPPSWNAHLPKLTGDARFLYAVHTHFPTAPVSARFAAILRRPRSAADAPWTEVARLTHVHQPPGVVMDTMDRLHLVFDCLREGTADVTCFPGGAGTGGVPSRFYHLIFNARDAAGALRWDTYLNYNEWTTNSNGYHGLATLPGGATVWALADTSWNRQVQWWLSPTQYGTLAPLSRPAVYLLYPILAPGPGVNGLLLYAGEFDPSGGTNAGYLASTAYRGTLSSGLAPWFRRTPTTPPARGAVGAFPSDLVSDGGGGYYALSYLAEGPSRCTELLRFGRDLSAPPTVTPVGCFETYARLQVSRDGTLFLLASAGDRTFRLGVSSDRGARWHFSTVVVTGLEGTDDVSVYGASLLRADTAPGIYDPDRMVLLFSGSNAAGLARRTYAGELALTP
ncbi:MAG: hypothetical protein HY909_28390 [Deltaproteobacteria bacterium]|nr:hypothetical protein [Deltaproteobacteria bacterium]